MYKRFTKMDISELFTEDSNVKGTTRGHTLTLEKPGCIRDSGNYFFSHRVRRPSRTLKEFGSRNGGCT